MFTRRRLLIAVIVVVGMIAAGWFGGRHSAARWAVRRALVAGGLDPAKFKIESVGLSTIRIADLSIGSEPWLTAASAEATFTLGGLLAARVGTIRLAGARWTVQARDGVIDWGYVPKNGDGPVALDIPLDLVEATGAVIHVVVDGATYDVQLDGRLAPAGPGALAGQLELVALGRKVTLAVKLKADDHQLTAAIDGQTIQMDAAVAEPAPATIPASPAANGQAASTPPQVRWHADLLRKEAGGAMQIDMDVTLDSIAERVGSVEVALSGASIVGHAVLGEGGMTGLTVSMSAKGLRAGGVTLQTVSVKATQAGKSALELEVSATGEGWELPAARGSVSWDTTGGSSTDSPKPTIVTTALRTEKPVVVSLDAAGITGVVESVTAAVRLQRGASGVHVLDGRVTVEGGSFQAGDHEFSEVHAELVMRGPEIIEVTSLAAVVGDGSIIIAQPFTWNPRVSRVQTRLLMSNLSLAHWLPIMTSKHATGEGRVSGSVDVAVDWSTGTVMLSELSGSLRADPGHGFIQARDTEALGELLEKQDPRFATDEVMRPVRDKIIAALRDFAFQKLTVDLSRTGDRTTALTYLSGFGRHGVDPQGVNLTLDLHVQDSFFDLASRIAARSRIRKAAGNALEEFFEKAPNEQEKP